MKGEYGSPDYKNSCIIFSLVLLPIFCKNFSIRVYFVELFVMLLRDVSMHLMGRENRRKSSL